MAHLVETMAYSKAEVPWHGLGVPVEHDLTPEQMLQKSGCDWDVYLNPGFVYDKEGNEIQLGWSALTRKTDESILSVVPNDWKTVQNRDAFDFFTEFVAEGHMNMETAGSLAGGQIVWALAKINDGFELCDGKDRIEPYMLFTNPHRYGWSTSVSMTAIRVVCNNTLTLSLNAAKTDRIIRVTHRNEFDSDEVKKLIGVSEAKLMKYKEMAQFLTSKRASDETVVEYFTKLFPKHTKDIEKAKEPSRTSIACFERLLTQPGAELAQGSWWQPYNAVTNFLDHDYGKTVETRLTSSWYGANRQKKLQALEMALEFANNS